MIRFWFAIRFACCIAALDPGPLCADEIVKPLAGDTLPASHPPSFWKSLCTKPRTICQPVLEEKKKSQILYDCKTEEFCLTRCPSLLGALFHDKRWCDQTPACDQPRQRRLLIKRVHEEKCPEIKCRPVVAPGECVDGCRN